MNAAALISLIQGVVPGMLPTGAPSAAGAGTSAEGGQAEPGAFAEALAAALAGQGAAVTLVSAPASQTAGEGAASATAIKADSQALSPGAGLAFGSATGIPSVVSSTSQISLEPPVLQPLQPEPPAGSAQPATAPLDAAQAGPSADPSTPPTPSKSGSVASHPVHADSSEKGRSGKVHEGEAEKSSPQHDSTVPMRLVGAAQSAGAALKPTTPAEGTAATSRHGQAAVDATPSLETRNSAVLPSALRPAPQRDGAPGPLPAVESAGARAKLPAAESAGAPGALPATEGAGAPALVADASPHRAAFVPVLPERASAPAASPTASSVAAQLGGAFTANPAVQRVEATVVQAPSGSTPALAPSIPVESAPAVAAPAAPAVTVQPALAEAAPIAAELSASAAGAIASSAPEAQTAKEPTSTAEAPVASTADGKPAGAPSQLGSDPQGSEHHDRHDVSSPVADDDAAVPLGSEQEAVFEPASGEAVVAATTATETRTNVPVRGAPETVASLAAQIARKLEGQNTRFEIALHPQDLGGVQVNVEINGKGELTAHLTFEKPEAAAELRARSAELQRALEQAGFDMSRGGLNFADGRGREHAQDQGQGRRTHARAFQEALLTADAADAPPARPFRLRDHVRSGLDVRI